jgi:hypothetical protein
MKGIAPNLETIGNMISAKTGSKVPSNPGAGPGNKFGDKKKKKHLNFNFMKKK